MSAGETIEFTVSTNPASKFTLALYRLGYYDGKGGRLMERLGPFQGSPQPDPPAVADCRDRGGLDKTTKTRRTRREAQKLWMETAADQDKAAKDSKIVLARDLRDFVV